MELCGVDGGDQRAHSLINVIYLSVNRRQTDLLIRSNCLVYITFVPHYNYVYIFITAKLWSTDVSD